MELLPTIGPQAKARLAGGFYVLNILTGGSALFLHGTAGSVVLLLAALSYVAVTALFFDLFRPVHAGLALLAACFSLIGCAVSLWETLHQGPVGVSPLVFFGCYCLLIGYLIARSTFLPTIFGVLMAVGGLGWLTFLSPALSKSLAPYNMAPGILGEAAFTAWLLIVGVNPRRWQEQRRTTSAA
ncbi:MAG: DUF4386 domain-containing protein [Gemmatimonadales bacterium]